MPGKKAIVGARVNSTIGLRMPVGTKKFIATCCHSEVYLAKAGQRMLAQGDVNIICLPCAMAVIAARPDIKQSIAPGAMEEFLATIQEPN